MPEAKYYNAQKAHEYYMRTRELKGREKKLERKTDKDKTALEFTQKEMAAERQKKDVERIRNVVFMKKAAISKQLEEISLKLAEVNKDNSSKIVSRERAAMQNINERAQQRLNAIPPIPDGVSKETRRRLAEERAKQIAVIRGEAQTEQEKVKADTVNQRNELSTGTNVLRKAAREQQAQNRNEAVSSELKQSMTKAQENYKNLRNALVESFKKQSEIEREAVSAS